MKKLTTLLSMLLLVFSAAGQGSIQGQISDWKQESARIVFVEGMTKKLVELGMVGEDGTFSIALPPDFIRQAMEMAEKAKAKAPAGWKLSFKDVNGAFSCDGDISYVNSTAIVVGLPELLVVDADANELGVLMASNSKEMAEWLFNYGMDEPVLGYHLQWYYMDAAASAKGTCSVETYTGSGEEKFNNITELNIDLKEGWNILKHHYSERFQSEDGRHFHSKLEITQMESPPKDLQWVVMRF